MTIADIPLGVRLTRQAGWNQLEADWLRFLAMQPESCFAGELDGQAAATTVTCILGPVAWIAMVLVDTAARRQGVATALLRHALDFLDGQGVKTVRLDATAAGRPVYEKLGFEAEYLLTRYEGVVPEGVRQAGTPRAAEGEYQEIVAFDREATDTHREKMLTRLFRESPEGVHILRRDGRLEGYVSLRRGANATQIGPCIATPSTGEVLLRGALGLCTGSHVFIDIPCDNIPAVGLAQRYGLQAQRQFTRMRRGEPVHDQPASIYASSGPEKG
ncbi:MAG: GNAT family N-acetyltransferase [Solirubrobacterales bacterium]